MVCTCTTNTNCTYPSATSVCTGSCSCSGTCSATSKNIFSQNIYLTQRQIWDQVRVPSSLNLMRSSALIVGSNRIGLINGKFNNQSSDKNIPSIQIHPVQTRGNSVRSTLTSLKPGACMPGGQGVDIKHNSYARYLGRKKACNIKPQFCNLTPQPKVSIFGL